MAWREQVRVFREAVCHPARPPAYANQPWKSLMRAVLWGFAFLACVLILTAFAAAYAVSAGIAPEWVRRCAGLGAQIGLIAAYLSAGLMVLTAVTGGVRLRASFAAGGRDVAR